MPGEVPNQPSSLAVRSPLEETNKAAKRNGSGEVTEKLQVVTSDLKKKK